MLRNHNAGVELSARRSYVRQTWRGPCPLKQPCGPQTPAVWGHCWLWMRSVPLLQGTAVPPKAAHFPMCHHHFFMHLRSQLLVLYMFFSGHPTKCGVSQEDALFYDRWRATRPPAPKSQHLWTLPVHDLLPQWANWSEPALSLRWVLSLLQDRGRALHWPSSRGQVLHQERRFGEQRRRTRGRTRYLES